MTATVQIPNTPEVFAKVEKRLAIAIREEASVRAFHECSVKQYEQTGRSGTPPLPDPAFYYAISRVREFRGIHAALKANLPVHLDAELYWSLTNE